MNKLLRRTAALWLGCALLLPTCAFAQDGVISSATVTASQEQFQINGTVDGTCSCVTIEIWDEDQVLVYMGPADVTNSSFSVSIPTGSKEAGTYTVKIADIDGGPYLVKDAVLSGSSSGGGTSTGGGISTGNKTETVTNPDGSITTTVTGADGATTVTTKYPDGTTTVTETGKDGAVQTTVKVPASEVGKDDILSLSMPEQTPASDVTSAPAITVDLAGKKDVKVEIPVKGASSGTVAILVDGGKETILMDTVLSDRGIIVTLSDGNTIKIVDNAKSFTDVPDAHWAKAYIDYVTSRGLFEGTGGGTFSPETAMTRAMGWTLLARYAGIDTSSGSTWYEVGQTWAMEQGISDGTDPDGALTREQLVTMLYRYAESPAAQGSLSAFTDAAAVSSWAKDAVTWAVSQGLLEGTGGGRLSPQDTATRAQVAALFARFTASTNI